METKRDEKIMEIVDTAISRTLFYCRGHENNEDFINSHIKSFSIEAEQAIHDAGFIHKSDVVLDEGKDEKVLISLDEDELADMIWDKIQVALCKSQLSDELEEEIENILSEKEIDKQIVAEIAKAGHPYKSEVVLDEEKIIKGMCKGDCPDCKTLTPTCDIRDRAHAIVQAGIEKLRKEIRK